MSSPSCTITLLTDEHVNEWISYGPQLERKPSSNQERNAIDLRKSKCDAMKKRLAIEFADSRWTENKIEKELDRLVIEKNSSISKPSFLDAPSESSDFCTDDLEVHNCAKKRKVDPADITTQVEGENPDLPETQASSSPPQSDHNTKDVSTPAGPRHTTKPPNPSTPKRQPTSFSGMIEFPLDSIKSRLICFSCKGYFREPYTVAECLHTFCKSCLFLKFHSGVRRCPKCEISLDPDPYKAVLADRTLQELLDKIFPELKEWDEKKELEFYIKRGIGLKDNIATGENTDNKNSDLRRSNSIGRSVSGSSPQLPYRDGPFLSKEASGAKQIPISADEITFKLIPDKNANIPMKCLDKELIRTSRQLKVGQIKKYLIKKLCLADSCSNIDVLCNGDPLGDELSLLFIQRTRWLLPSQDLCLHYRFGEDGAY